MHNRNRSVYAITLLCTSKLMEYNKIHVLDCLALRQVITSIASSRKFSQTSMTTFRLSFGGNFVSQWNVHIATFFFFFFFFFYSCQVHDSQPPHLVTILTTRWFFSLYKQNNVRQRLLAKSGNNIRTTSAEK